MLLPFEDDKLKRLKFNKFKAYGVRISDGYTGQALRVTTQAKPLRGGELINHRHLFYVIILACRNSPHPSFAQQNPPSPPSSEEKACML